MAENFTREHNLVEDISSKGWLANPAGRQGYEVVVLEQVGDAGSRFYCSLKPGETLRLSERVFGKFTALAVDIRHARAFPISGSFATAERGQKVTMQANVRYRVTDARVVAMETLDPLGELRDKVVATLTGEFFRYQESEITPALVVRIIRNVGPVPHLGLTVEDAEVIEFTPDTRRTSHVIEEEDLRHQLAIGGIKRQADLAEQGERQETEIRLKRDRHTSINLSDINVLMHEYPDLIPQIFKTFADRDQRLLEAQIGTVRPAIDAYIQQKLASDDPIDPEEIARIMRQAVSSSRPQIQGPIEHAQLKWGDESVDNPPPEKPPIKFSEDEREGKVNSESSNDSSRIKFAD